MELANLPDVTFAAADPAQMDLDIVATVEAILQRKLERADPLRLFLRGLEAVIIQQRLLIDATAKQNLLAYATGEYLDHLGALLGVERIPASYATTTLKLTLSARREQVTVIPANTRFTADDDVYFALDAPIVFSAGETQKSGRATCLTVGEAGNGYSPGEINKIVDPRPFLQAAENITISGGGAAEEDDDALRERIHEAPEAFSTAGSVGAYKFHTRAVNALIKSVFVDSPKPGDVVIYPLLKDGEIPGEEILSAVDAYLNKETIRPLTDRVTVKPPGILSYDVDLTYYIGESDAGNATAIAERVETAIAEYITWQGAALGRDINDDELRVRIRNAGAKRAVIRSPFFTRTPNNKVARVANVSTVYGGIEED